MGGRALWFSLLAVASGLVGGALPAAASAQGRCGSYPWCDTTLTPDQRATLLLGAEPQSDKIAMLTAEAAPDVNVPAIQAADGAVGVRTTTQPGYPATAFPAALALAANFDPVMAKAYGGAVGAEQRLHGFDLNDGPTVNIMRTPLGGRTFEAYGEDPFLVAQNTVAWTQGLQAQGVMATAKHFIENDQEGQLGASPLLGASGGRQITNVIVDQRTLHEVELRAFTAAVQQAHTASVMCSYNEINGQFGCDSPDTLQTILRHELGFQGIIQSDLLAAHTPQADLNAGMNWDIGGNSDNAALVTAALLSGQVSQATLDARVHEYLQTLFAYGFFDRPAYANTPAAVDRAHSTAVDLATEEGGATLLKNNGVLPLTGTHRRIAVIGYPAQKYVFGFGSSQVTPYATVSLLQGIQARAAQAGDTVTYDDGTNMPQATADAKRADVAIVVAGDSESEGDDKQCMSLVPQCAPTQTSTITPDDATDAQSAWGNQDSLISAVAAVNPRTVTVLETGAPVLTPWRDRLAALLEAWYPGQDGGTAVARVLWGDADPGGRLPVTFPAGETQEPTAGNPASYPGVPVPAASASAAAGTLYNETFTEGVFVGYRFFDQHHLTPAYPFGFGLSYTSFALSALKISGSGPGTSITATVKNTGARTGAAVAELYLGLPEPSPAIAEPPAQLAGFQKLQLAPGQSRRVKLTIDARDLSYWDTASGSWQIAPGCTKVMLGSSSRDLPLQGTLAQGGAKCPNVPSGPQRKPRHKPKPKSRPHLGCPAAPGRLSASTLGPITLGQTRARVRRGLERHSNVHRAAYIDVFCFTPIGIRVGYPPPAAARQLSTHDRAATAGRAVLILSANRHYTLSGVRPGVTLASAARTLRLQPAIRTHLNTWYIVALPGVTGVLKVRRGRVLEVGVADPRFTRSPGLATRFLAGY